MGRPLVQFPKSHPGIPKDLDLANTPRSIQAPSTYRATIGSTYSFNSRLEVFLLSFAI
jgi:hypothetical protein